MQWKLYIAINLTCVTARGKDKNNNNNKKNNNKKTTKKTSTTKKQKQENYHGQFTYNIIYSYNIFIYNIHIYNFFLSLLYSLDIITLFRNFFTPLPPLHLMSKAE